MTFARRLLLVGCDHRFGQGVQTHLHKTFLLSAPVVKPDDLGHLVTRDTDGVVVFLASEPADAERVERAVRELKLQGLPPRVGVLFHEGGATARQFEGLAAHVEGVFAWGTQLRELNAWLRRAVTPGVPFVDPAHETAAERVRRKLLALTPSLVHLTDQLDIAAAHDVTVLIEGETGTGKEVLAESLHEMSPRASGPFVVFDCTAVPPNLVESALFGHERGAYTGATESRRGVFEEAHGGTLLLDELGDLELSLQAKLLRVLERSEVQRVGSNRWVKVDTRVLAATRRDLDHEIQAGRFRDDLFFRLAVARIELPPLRRRAGDVTVLAFHFWRHLAGKGAPFPADFAQRLESYTWPGNVRELYNAVARRVALGDLAAVETARSGPSEAVVTPIPSATSSSPGRDVIEEVLAQDLPLTRARERVVEEFERRYVTRVLAQHGGNVSKASAASGIARRYFQLLRARHGS